MMILLSIWEAEVLNRHLLSSCKAVKRDLLFRQCHCFLLKHVTESLPSILHEALGILFVAAMDGHVFNYYLCASGFGTCLCK